MLMMVILMMVILTIRRSWPSRSCFGCVRVISCEFAAVCATLQTELGMYQELSESLAKNV